MSLIGSIDRLTENCVSGWAADDSDWMRGLCVDVSVNSVVVTVPAAEFREDLRAAGIGDGCKAFAFDPSPYLRAGRNIIELRFAGTKQRLPRGHVVWVRLRGTALIAALEAYHEFLPDDYVCAMGEGAEELQRTAAEAGLPYRKFSVLDRPPGRFARSPDVMMRFGGGEPAVRRRGLHVIECGAAEVEGGWYESIGSQRFAFVQAGMRPPAAPVLAHIHVPKCAGTAFRVMLERAWGGRMLPLYVDDTYFVYGEETLRNYLMWDRELRGLSSHHVRAFPRWLAGREMLYVTFLRDPVEQFVSYMTHIQKYYATITDRNLLDAVPPDAPRLTLREFARWLLTQERDVPFRENHNVNFFARYSAPAGDRLAAARAALDGFFFVGITEHIEDSMQRLRARARQAGLDFPGDALPTENVSRECRGDLSWIHPEDEVGRMLLRSVALDRQLYDWALIRNARQ
ncbi:MAG TPA: hypothetical protein VMU80_13505 [Bryobacteraceae bacterium]|nr:hypothetical protein [Bryobacteraceae bacterium]